MACNAYQLSDLSMKKYSHDTKIKVIDFFCGCGGASAGFRKSGLEIALGIDFDEHAAASYQANFPDAKFIQDDIRNVQPEQIEKMLTGIKKSPLLFSACAPCQPFSSQNKNKFDGDNRISLLDETNRFISYFKPEFIFIENVPGIQKIAKDKDSPFGRFLKFLDSLGYQYHTDIVHAQFYGVPQKRKRLVLIASRLGDICIPEPTHGVEGKKPFATVRDYILGYPQIKSGEKDPSDPLHVAAKMDAINLERIAHTPEGGDRRDWPKRLINKCHQEYTGHTDTYGRMRWDALAPTLTTKCNSYSNGRFGHPDVKQLRAISIREASRLQTFPKTYKFKGTIGYLAKQIGNAVPVELACQFGHQIKACFKKSIKG